MSVYFMANIRISDPIEYKKYLDRSEDYKEILQYRLSAATCDTILIHGN